MFSPPSTSQMFALVNPVVCIVWALNGFAVTTRVKNAIHDVRDLLGRLRIFKNLDLQSSAHSRLLRHHYVLSIPVLALGSRGAVEKGVLTQRSRKGGLTKTLWPVSN
jgi:hypothetical protein